MHLFEINISLPGRILRGVHESLSVDRVFKTIEGGPPPRAPLIRGGADIGVRMIEPVATA